MKRAMSPRWSWFLVLAALAAGPFVLFDRSPVEAQGATADLTLTQQGPSGPILVGDPVNYTLTVVNHGPADATNLTIVDTLPPGLTIGSTYGGGGSSGVFTCPAPSG